MTMFYTYIYRDPSRQNEPFYVGKGTKDRAFSHLKRKDRHPMTHRVQKMLREGVQPDIEIIPAIDEKHAFFMEECCIQVIGRRDLGKGPLLNLTDGGEGPTGARFKMPSAAKSKISASMTGRTLSESHIANLKGKVGMLGQKYSDSAKAQIGMSNKVAWADETRRKLQSERVRAIWARRKAEQCL